MSPHLVFSLSLLYTATAFNKAVDFMIGTESLFGAIELPDDVSILDLSKCGKALCPSVLIFVGKQWGTISLKGCKIGRLYFFINRSDVDLGIVLQQEGGMFGSKAVGRFDLVTCFCIPQGLEDHVINEIRQGDGEKKGIMLCR
jgi:hypothetical protein